MLLKLFTDLFQYRREVIAPFFLPVGYKKPHLPFVFPHEFQFLYPIEDIDLANKEMNFTSYNMPDVAWSKSVKFTGKGDLLQHATNWTTNSTFPEDVARSLRRGYYSSVSFMDSLVGDLLRELESLGAASDTIVVFIGDHGYHLGWRARHVGQEHQL